MTGMEVLIEDVCPYMLAEWLNRVNDVGVFSRKYIQQLEDDCETWSCRECWEKFLKEELFLSGLLRDKIERRNNHV